jgi:hypothetical protein
MNEEEKQQILEQEGLEVSPQKPLGEIHPKAKYVLGV